MDASIIHAFKCSTCGHEERNKEGMKKHLCKEHLQWFPICCSRCEDVRLTTKTAFMEHHSRFHVGLSATYLCTIDIFKKAYLKQLLQLSNQHAEDANLRQPLPPRRKETDQPISTSVNTTTTSSSRDDCNASVTATTSVNLSIDEASPCVSPVDVGRYGPDDVAEQEELVQAQAEFVASNESLSTQAVLNSSENPDLIPGSKRKSLDSSIFSKTLPRKSLGQRRQPKRRCSTTQAATKSKQQKTAVADDNNVIRQLADAMKTKLGASDGAYYDVDAAVNYLLLPTNERTALPLTASLLPPELCNIDHAQSQLLAQALLLARREVQEEMDRSTTSDKKKYSRRRSRHV